MGLRSGGGVPTRRSSHIESPIRYESEVVNQCNNFTGRIDDRGHGRRESLK